MQQKLKISQQLNNKNMAKYEITLEFETVVSVNGVRVKVKTSHSTQIVTGVFTDVVIS